MDLKLKNKRILITGASKGLGYETAQVLAEEGANLAINSRDEKRINDAAKRISQQTGSRVIAIPGDAAQLHSVATLVDDAARLLGGLDILITNTGGPPSGRFEQFSDDVWQQAIESNFLSHMRLIRASLPYLRKSETPAVLTITSYSVKQPIPNLVLSNSIRAATVGLTKSLALELGSEGIRFNSILPGWTRTDRVAELMEARARDHGTTAEEEMAAQVQSSPLGRMAEPREFAVAAAFLVSPLASYITGVMLAVDGGMYRGLL